MINPFFKNTGPHDLKYLLKAINVKIDNLPEDKINDIKDLNYSKKNEIIYPKKCFISRRISKKFSKIAESSQ